jgi:glycerate dehydrogenase
MSENNPLKEIQDSARLIITPHIAWATIEARERVAREVYKNIEAYLNNTERNIVTG